MTELDEAMVEKAARAICVKHAMYDPDMIVTGRDNKPWPYWREFETDARAALTAILPDLREQHYAECRRAALEEAALRLDREWPGPASKIVRALIDKEPT